MELQKIALTVPLHHPALEESDCALVAEALRNGALGSDGVYGRRLEEAVRARWNVPFVFPVPSCGAALELAMMAAGVGPGDEVILPSFNFPSAANAALRQAATVVFCDIDPETFCLDPEDFSRRITPKTRAVVVVHYGPYLAPMDEILKIARARGILVIEDAAHAIGAAENGRYAGTIGDIGCFSFHSTKNLAVGEGGMLVTTRSEIARRVEIIRCNGTDRKAFERGEAPNYRWVEKGGSFFLAEPLAALAWAQFERLEREHEERRRRAKTLLHGLEGALLPLVLPFEQSGVTSSWHIFPILTERDDRNRLLEHLRRDGVGAAFHYLPLHSSPFGKRLGSKPEDCPVSTDVSERLIRLPLYPSLSPEAIEAIMQSVKSAFART